MALMDEILFHLTWAIYAPDSPYATIMALVIGLEVGSFLNVVVYRLPIMWERRRIVLNTIRRGGTPPVFPPCNPVVPRSRCPRCGHLISWWENIPVVSYCLLVGKCRSCNQPISLRYPIVELQTGVLFLTSFAVWQWHWYTVLAWWTIFIVTVVGALLIGAKLKNPIDKLTEF